MHSALAPIAHDPISPFTFDYRGTQTVISKVKGGRWCYGHSGGRGKRCAPTFRQAILLAKHAVDARHQYGHENPVPATENPGGGGILLALVAAALAGGGVYLYMRHNANTAAITDPAQIIMAKVNLAQIAAGSPGQNITYVRDQPMTSATPTFAQGLAQFQVALNKMVTPDKLAALQKEVGQVQLPPLPLRTDGVLDRPTFDWLIYAQG